MTAYYNERDAFAAQWLRNLIAAGHLPAGEVDERDIRDVTPAELIRYTQCHFFAGVGVWPHALRRAGWPDDRPIWTGSCPCQPFSAAGNRGGFDDERHLWPSWYWLIEQCRPPVVAGEQVASKDGLAWLDLVSADLEASGYTFGAADLCAAGAGVAWGGQEHEWLGRAVHDCPDPVVARQLRDFADWARESLAHGGSHIRQRLYFVGVADDGSGRQEAEIFEPRHGRPPIVVGQADGSGGSDVSGGLADAAFSGSGTGLCGHGSSEQRRILAPDDGSDGGMGNPERPGLQEQRREPGLSRAPGGESSGQGSGRADASAGGRGSGADAADRRGAAPDWLFCRDGRWRPVEAGTFPLAHAAPARVGKLRAFGNALDGATAAAFVETVMGVLEEARG